jgi:Histidine kinase-, DNA gyrase B-, and HSP90-like ATPase
MILRHRLKASGHRSAIEIVKDYAKLPPIECYPGQLNQVFMNILANAIDALEESLVISHSSLASNESERTNDKGQMTLPTITIRTQILDKDWIVIRIADNGLGMNEKVLQRIYDPFFTTKEIGKGTGLGMAISHQIVVDKHGGILKCRSQLGEGTEFWIQIPVHYSVVETTEGQSYTSSHSSIPPTESSPIVDTEGFISATIPTVKPVDLLIRHTQLIQRLSEQNPDLGTASAEQIYQMFQRHPIFLKLYATLLSWFSCSNPNHINH